MRTVLSHHARHHILQELEETVVGNAGFKWYVKCVFFAIAFSLLEQPSSSREEILAVLVERDTHASIGQVEGFLNTIAVMHVDVQIQYSWIHLQQLQDSQHYVIYIAKATCL